MVWFPVLFLALLLAGACSDENTAEREATGEFVEGTLSSPQTPEPTQTQATTTTGETTTGGTVATPAPDILLRLEGDTKTTFSGICTVGGEESVISGQVPKLYRFEPNGRDLSCRIQKRDPGNGNLRVVLLSGDDTRSVQQTNSPEGIVRLSYRGE